jgi:AcrR family transcriptional regulator
MKKRKYRKSLRAEQQAQTRERIVEAAMQLHEEVGPALTSIKAVAEKAGVQRLTVYRHFPDDFSLFQACTSHWFELNPPPDENDWLDIADATERTRNALLAFYRYYRVTEQMWSVSYRDLESVEALHEPMAAFDSYLKQVSDDLLKSWQATGEQKKQLRLTLSHALKFSSWQSLKNEQLGDEKIAMLVTQWLHGISSPA